MTSALFTGWMKRVTVAAIALLALANSGCQRGPQGPAGPAGVTGSSSDSRIISTMNCSGVVANLTGPASVLNGLEVDYDAVLTTTGDVYASASVADQVGQDSDTAFYAAGQNGAQTGAVLITADYSGTSNSAYWQISLDRETLITTAVYTDSSLGGQSPVTMTFTASACSLQEW